MTKMVNYQQKKIQISNQMSDDKNVIKQPNERQIIILWVRTPAPEGFNMVIPRIYIGAGCHKYHPD